VVGRAPAAALRHARGAGDGRQTRAPDTAALAALVQCLVRLEATEGFASPRQALAMEVLDENRFLASRDGTRAMLIDVDGDARIRWPDVLEALLVACAPACTRPRLRGGARRVRGLLDDPGDERQRRRGGVARGDPVGDALGTVVEALAADFTGSRATASGAPGAGRAALARLTRRRSRVAPVSRARTRAP
jgi:carboxylate-amine ligase